jgi:phosphoribosylaminoimidazolecarboxamide formyltransferase/IMP cyclohydrolase
MGRIARALVSVSDKKGVVELCQALVARSVSVVSTGGTAKALRDAGVPVMDVSELTGSPEIMDGRVKTLHPRVHGGILMRDLDTDRADLSRIGGSPIDLVVVNLYPFEATVARNAPHDEIIENIDIGGPCMIRASAKNHARVTVVVDPRDYDRVLASIDKPDAALNQSLRAELALKAFAHTAAYDKAITEYLQKVQG